MKQYYLERLHWIFNFTSKNFFYCIAKSLCLIIGIPIYAVMFAAEMILTFINMIFSWIPILNVVVGFICKSLVFLFDKTFYICILTDIKQWRQAHKSQADYEVENDEQMESIQIEESFENDSQQSNQD